MRILIIDNQTTHREELIALFDSIPDVITKKELAKRDPSGYDLIVLSGGSKVPTVLNHPEEYIEEINFVKNSTKPVLGICLGCEIIVKAFEGELQELDTTHTGTLSLEITNAALKEKIKKSEIQVYESHRVGMQTAPPDFEVCASGDHGPEIIKHLTRPIIGIQFHPEATTNKKLLSWVYASFGLR